MERQKPEVRGEICPLCNGEKTHFQQAIRFWMCDTCSTTWAVGSSKTYFQGKLKYHETKPDTTEN